MSTFFGGAAGAALVTGLFALIMWILNRQAAKRDKQKEKQDDKAREECKSVIDKFNGAIDTINAFVEELGSIKADLGELKVRNQKQDDARSLDKALSARRRILQFADEIRRGVRHSMEHFNSILEDVSCYKDYCKEHEDFQNDKAVRSMGLIGQVYERCMIENDFL